MNTKVEWNSAQVAYGAQSVMTSGMMLMPWSSVVSWDTLELVGHACSREVYTMRHYTLFKLGARGIQRAFFGQGTGDILLDDVQCVGTEARLTDCPAITTHNCAHSEDSGVVCLSDPRKQNFNL